MSAVIIVLGLIGVAIAAPRQTQRIVGGAATTVERYPYMANMQWGGFGFYFQRCGGSLITEQTVLTAAHCYDGDSGYSRIAVLGASLTSGTDGTAHAVSRLVTHERYINYGTGYDNDVAIVILTTRATLSSKISLASIAGPNYNLADGTMVTAIGFGMLYHNGPQPTELQHVQIPTINQEVCQNYYAAEVISPGMLCSGILDVGGKDACTGDSGGPVVHGANWDIIIGITSWGIGCADGKHPGVNVRVSNYSDWIVANAV